MKWVLLPKREGKSTALIKWADLNENPMSGRYIVCLDRERVQQLVRLADEMECDIHFPLTLHEAQRPYGPGVRELGIDDVDDILRALLRTHAIEMVTATITGKEADDRDENEAHAVMRSLSPDELKLLRAALHEAKHSWFSKAKEGSGYDWGKQAREAAELEDKINGE